MSIPQAEPSELLTSIIRDVAGNPLLNREMVLMLGRQEMFPSALTAQLTGIYMNPAAREYVDARLDEEWSRDYGTSGLETREHLIGAGTHAAVYAATRAAMGKPRPVAWESGTPGGVWAVGGGMPVFNLNSRNRPGTPGIPEVGNLNNLPGAVIQPSHIASGQYPDNAVLRWCVRMTLAAYADVRKGRVMSYGDDQGTNITLQQGERFSVRRIIDARGMGTDSSALLPDRSRRRNILTFLEFMDAMTQPFPLRGIRRAAVIGDGNSSRCAVESLLGIAPGVHMSTPELDWVRQVDWYGDGIPRTREDWKTDELSGRYMEIARYLPRQDTTRKSESRRLRVIPQQGFPLDGPESASVGARSYDLVIVCTGLTRRNDLRDIPAPVAWNQYSPDGASAMIARRYQGKEIYAIGPICLLVLSSQENAAGLSQVPGLSVSILRTAPKTAQLAMTLD